MSETPLSTALDAQIIDCLRCAARLTFTRNYPSRIDAAALKSIASTVRNVMPGSNVLSTLPMKHCCFRKQGLKKDTA